MEHGEFYNEDLEKDNRQIEIYFNVVCSSPVSMQEGKSLMTRIKQFIHDCQWAIEEDSGIKHWGDFEFFIDIDKVKLVDWDKDGNELSEDIEIDKLDY